MDKKNIDTKLEEALKKDFEFTLPESFADEVLLKLNLANEKSDKNLYWLLFGSGLFMAMACLITVSLYTNFEVFSYIGQYGGWGIFILGLIAVVQYLDKKLIKEKMGVPKLN